MQLYIDIIRETIASRDMQEHLVKNVHQLSCANWADMICSVPIEAVRKVELLEKLSEYEEEEKEKEYYTDIANHIRYLLSCLEVKKGELLCLCGCRNENGTRCQFESAPFSSLEKVMEYLKEEQDGEDDAVMDYWYVLEKWESDEYGNFTETVKCIILNDKICYVKEFATEKRFPNRVSFECDLDVPTPFRVGDIVTIDCRPIQPIRRVLILETGIGSDCCYPLGLYVRRDKELDVGAIKHNMVFRDTDAYISMPEIPALFRAEKYDGVLLEGELVLREISQWLQRDESKGRKLCAYMYAGKDIRDVLGFIRNQNHL